MRQDITVDPRDLLDEFRQRVLRPERLPLPRQEGDYAGRDEFLESPCTLEPSAFPELRFLRLHIVVRGNVGKESIADLGIAVPIEHRVDGLRQLGAARLVDTGRVDPDVLEAIMAGNLARLPDLLGEAGIRVPDRATRGRRGRSLDPATAFWMWGDR